MHANLLDRMLFLTQFVLWNRFIVRTLRALHSILCGVIFKHVIPFIKCLAPRLLAKTLLLCRNICAFYNHQVWSIEWHRKSIFNVCAKVTFHDQNWSTVYFISFDLNTSAATIANILWKYLVFGKWLQVMPIREKWWVLLPSIKGIATNSTHSKTSTRLAQVLHVI